ncbi:MAG: YcxB family protein [Gammaproteobacteria bacterium]|nr:YcxB family protein [Gammaproteobacteria bacterium]
MKVATYQISESDYVNAMRLHGRVTNLAKQLLLLLLLILLALILWGGPMSSALSMGVLIGSALVVLIGRYILNPWMARRQYRTYPTIQEPVTISLEDEGVRLSSAEKGGVMHWRKIRKWQQNNDYVLLYTKPRAYHIVPKSIDKEEFDTDVLTDKLRRRVGPEM